MWGFVYTQQRGGEEGEGGFNLATHSDTKSFKTNEIIFQKSENNDSGERMWSDYWAIFHVQTLNFFSVMGNYLEI